MGEAAVTVPGARRLAGSAALIATAGGLAAIALQNIHWVEWSLLAFSGLVGVAGVGLARKSIVTQVLSRATAWLVLAPSALVTLVTLLGNSSHMPDFVAAGLAAGSGGALLLARPMLHTIHAREAFHPKRFRRWLLGASTAAAATGMTAGIVALEAMRWQPSAAAAGLGALALALLASAIGTVRMRAWGILLGAVTSLASVVAALALHDAAGAVMLLAAIPGVLLAAPILWSQRSSSKNASSTATHARIADELATTHQVTRYRIADAPSDPLLDDEDDGQPARAESTEARRISIPA